MKVIECKDLYKTYEAVEPVHAVNGVNLEIKKGEFTAVVGPSGSGKTTLLNMVGGLDRPTKGNILVNGTDLNTLSENQLIDFRMNNIGFVFQAYNLVPVLTAWENIAFILQLQKKPQKEIEDRVKFLLDSVGLSDKKDIRPGKLSGGQQQRVAVARALASKPQFILADEPTANLDSHSTNNLLDIMKKMNLDESITFIFSTHDQRVIDKAERVLTLDDGKIINDELRT